MASWRKRRLLRRLANSLSRPEKKRRAVRRLFSESLEQRMLLAVLTGSDPANHAFAAPLSTNVSATFDEALNAATVTPQTFVVHGTLSTGQLVGSGTTLSVDGNTATHDPANNFAPGEIVNVTITSGLSGATAATPTVYQFRAGVTGGSGQFEDSGQVIPGGPGFVVFGDADGDGDLDALQGANLWLNDGNANFTDSGQNVGAGQERDFADLDGDGDLDVASSTIWFNDGNGVFTQGAAAGGGGAIDVGDLDGDGDLDIFSGTGGYNGNRVWFNNGAGAFTDSGQVLNGGFDQSRGVQLGDFDNDGDLDAFAGNWTSPDRVWLNDGAGIMTLGFSTSDTSSTQDIDLGDFDNDGDLDVFLAHAGGTGTGDMTSRILFNDGTGASFTQEGAIDPGRTTWATEAGDMDADGDLDLVVFNRTGGNSTIWANDGAGNFSQSGSVTFAGDRRIYGGDIGDLNGDGSLDLWEANVHPPTGDRIWLNTVLNPDVTLSIDNATIAEDGGTATVTASIASAFDQPVTVDLGFSGDATLDTDYTASGTQIVISTGSTSGTVTLTATQDGLDEADEGIDVAIVAVQNGQPAGGAQSVSTAVTDDDDAPTLTLSVDSTSIGETGGEATITATLSAASGQDVTVELAATGAAATLSATEIVISAGDTTGTATLSAVDDAIDEPDETVTVEVAAAVNATEDGDQEVTVTVTDDDEPPVVTLAVDADSIEEDGGVATFTATMSGPSLTDTTIDLTIGGTATVTDDYTASGTQIVIAAGETSGSITVTSVADTNITEGPETVSVDIAAVAGNASEDGEQSATTTIIDDVNGPDVTIAVDNTTIAEAGGVATVTATLAAAFSLDVTISFDITGTATAGTDYTASATEIVVAAGGTSGTITLTGVDDGAIEGDETIDVAVAAVINGNEVGDQEVTVTVTDDESPPNVTLSVDPDSIAEAGGVATLTATLSAASEQDVTVDLAAGGTASAADYTLSATQIVVSAGSTTGTATVTAVDDGDDDDDETVTIEIAAVANANEDGTQEVTVTIIDDDDAPPLPPGPTPPNAEVAASRNTVVGYTFPGSVPADAANDETFAVFSPQDGQLVGGATTVSQNGATALHTPTNRFRPGELVQATVTSALGPAAVWQFYTEVSGGLGTFDFGNQDLNNSTDENHASYGSVLADFDSDGDLDIFFANGNNFPASANANRVWINDGSGTFSDTGQRLGDHNSRDVAAGDVDGDGDVDVVVSNDGGQANRAWINDGNGVFTSLSFGANNGERIRLGDLDGDGDLDAFVANGNTGNGVYMNDGAGNFSGGATVGNHASFGVDLGDIDGDGDLDALVANGNTNYEPNKVWLNNGSGSFTDSGQVFPGRPGTSVGIADLDSDGDLDAVWGYFSGDDIVMLNDGSGVFTQIQNFAPTATYSRTTDIKFGDVDADGDLDVMVTSQLNRPSIFFTNDGNGMLTQGAVLTHPDGGTNTNSAALGDVDNDGDIDFIENVGNSLNVSRRPSNVWFNQNPPQPTVSLAVDPDTIAEAGGVATVTANLSAASTEDVTIELSLGGTATSGDDYSASGNQIVIAAGATDGSVTITANDDSVDEPDETVVVQTSNITGGLGGGTVTVTITDDDEPVVPDVSLAVDNGSIPEDGGVATFTATLSEATSVDVTVDLTISGDAAASDYTASGTQIMIGAGETSGSITVTAVQDEDDEADESVTVEIAAVANGNEDGEQSATTTIVDDDGPTSFRVSVLTGTASGFVAEFNGTLDAGDLNLYDAESVNAGDPDVTVTGATVGAVNGSLAVDPALNKITFVATGGELAADTYTVTLRSAADGFEDDGGLLLDGNGDGTAGDDYSSTFTVDAPAAGAVTLSLPDVVRGPGQPVNIPATGAGLPLTISEGAGVRSVTVSVDYDPALLSITGAEVGENMPAGSTVDVDTSTAGTAVITFTSPADLPAGENVVANLTADVPTENANDIYRLKQVLDLHSATVTDSGSNNLPVIDNDAIHVVEFFGDVSGNARINAADAAQVARIAALLETGFASALLADPTTIGDITGNARLNAADASRVAQFAALIPVEQIPEIPAGVVTSPTNLGPDPRLKIPQDVTANAGDAITVPVLVDSVENLVTPDRILAAGLVIFYDADVLTINTVTPGTFLTSNGWSMSSNLLVPGRIIVAAFGSTAVGGEFSDVDLVNLNFTVAANAPSGATRINLAASTPGAFTELLGEADQTLVLDGPVTNEDMDPVDGVITIAGAAAGPTVTLAVDNDAIAEAGGVATFTATLSAASTADVTVDLGISGTATSGDDYTASGSQIVIAAGATSGSVTVTAVDDAIDDDDETVVVEITGVTGGTEDGEQSATTTITDDDAAAAPTVTLAVDSDTIAEAGGVATVTATLSAAATADVTVDLGLSGTATSGTDYAASATQIVISAGATSGTATITATDDTDDEEDETVIVDVTAVTGATEDGDQQVTVTITDDDGVAAAANRFSIPRDLTAAPNDTITVPVNIQTLELTQAAGNRLAGVGVALRYDADVLTVVNVTPGNFIAANLGWTLVPNTAVAGQIVLVGFTSTPVAGEINDVLANIEFTVNAGAAAGPTVINLIPAAGPALTELLDENDGTLPLADAVTADPTDDVDGVITIAGAAGPTVSLAVDADAIAEAGGVATFTATLSAASTADVTVDLGISGTATSGDDYTSSGSQIVIAAGATSGSITVTAVDDAIDDDDETVVVEITNVAGATEDGEQSATTTITDDDDAALPTVTLAVDADAIAEAGGVATFTATLSETSTADVTVDLGISGTATSGDDYTSSGSQIVIAAGATSGSITVTAVDDAIDDDDETVVVEITNVAGATEDGEQSATTTITDDDDAALPTVTLAVDADAIAEAGGVATFTATLSAASTADVTVDLGISGTATSGDDYTSSGSQIVIAAGATSGSITVTAVDDAIDDDDETVVVEITNVAGATEDGEQSATTTITDDDDAALPTVTLAVDADAIAEAGGVATFTATLSETSTADVTVDLGISGTATSGDDYTSSGSQIVIAAGATSGSITVTAVDDAIDDDDETVVVEITNVAGATEDGEQSATTTITDDDDPAGATVTLAVDADAIAEAGGVATFTATLSETSTADVTVDLGISGTATAGDDYTSSGSQIVIAAGATSGSITVTAVDDAIDDDDETVVVEITDVAGATEDGEQSATTTITDDDAAPLTVSLAVDNAAIDEAGGVATFTATLSETSTADVTVDLGITGTATNGDDYTVSGTQIVIAAGSTSGSITVTAVDDAIDDDDETVVVDITAVTGATGSGAAVTTITDNDGANEPPVLTVPGTLTLAVNMPSVDVELTATDPNAADTLTFSAVGETAEYALDQRLGLTFTGDFFENFSDAQTSGRLALNERWLLGDGEIWYYITPDGSFYEWHGGSVLNRTLVAELASTTYDDPALLYNAQAGGTAPATVAVNGTTLTITPNAGFMGSFGVNVTVSDGSLTDSELILVNMAENEAPVLDDPGDQTLPTTQDTLDVALSATDPNAGDPLTYSAVAESAEYYLDQTIGFQLSADGLFPNWSGTEDERWVLSDDFSTWYFITPDGALYRWLGGGRDILANAELVANLSPATHADPALLYDAQAGGTAPATVSVTGSTLTIDPNAGFVGLFAVSITVTDAGGLSDTRLIRVDVTAAPAGGLAAASDLGEGEGSADRRDAPQSGIQELGVDTLFSNFGQAVPNSGSSSDFESGVDAALDQLDDLLQDEVADKLTSDLSNG